MYKAFKKMNIDAYLVNPQDRIIFSDPSEDATEFGTDIQTRGTLTQIAGWLGY